jgi:hypothetical protein
MKQQVKKQKQMKKEHCLGTILNLCHQQPLAKALQVKLTCSLGVNVELHSMNNRYILLNRPKGCVQQCRHCSAVLK